MLDPTSQAFIALTPFEQLVEIMAALRAPDGCPWDREQTHQTLTRFLLEETYETLEAIDNGDTDAMCEELGDLLLQIVFHAQLAREAGTFVIDDVCKSIVDKMVVRHPHVFGGGQKLANGAEVLQQWEQIKLAGKGQKKRSSLMEGIPRGNPALLMAERIQDRAAEVGFEWPDSAAAFGKLKEELAELEADPSEEELGDVLFAAVSLARKLKVDPEAALRATCRKFVDRFQRLEEQHNGDLSQIGAEDLHRGWNALK